MDVKVLEEVENTSVVSVSVRWLSASPVTFFSWSLILDSFSALLIVFSFSFSMAIVDFSVLTPLNWEWPSSSCLNPVNYIKLMCDFYWNVSNCRLWKVLVEKIVVGR